MTVHPEDALRAAMAITAKAERKAAFERDGRGPNTPIFKNRSGRAMTPAGRMARDLAEQGKSWREIMETAGVGGTTASRAIKWAARFKA